MTPERLRQIEDLFHAASEVPAGEREAFLARACNGDTTLQGEVESLLAGREGTLLAGGIAGAAAQVLRAHGSREGSTIGVYQLGPVIGVGGMGEVYRARDTRLGRDVAVKILPPAFTGQAERLARFEREARILATLNHPNIASIYGFEESDGVRALILELVEGATLAEKLQDEHGNPRALPVEESLDIARQIAVACEAAHRKGIIHRDLKPANITIAVDGTVKVLDFGVAKFEVAGDAGPRAGSVTATGEGAVLGTVAYMSPEQARGLAVDRRTDIWAFGCVLYEMLTGSRSFPGDTSADVLGAITSREPDWALLPSSTPQRIRDVIRRCLAKDAARRYHDIADVRLEVEEAINPDSGPARPAASTRSYWRYGALTAGAIAIAVALTVWIRAPQQALERRGPARVSIELPPDVAVYAIGRASSVAVSPDGQSVIYVAVAGDSTRLLSRRLDGLQSMPLAGTEGAANPFFSPDGRWVGFWVVNRALKKIPVSGGPATTIVTNASFLGAAWADDDTIVYQSDPGGELWRVPSAGGTPVKITTRASATEWHSWPQLLPESGSLLYTIWNNTGFEGGRIVVQPLSGGPPTVVAERSSYGKVIKNDDRAYLIIARAEGLFAAPFDVHAGRPTGNPVMVQEGVMTNLSGGAHYSVSNDGVLAYVPGSLDEVNKTLLWVDKSGNVSELPPMPGVGFQYRISPDGQRLARPNAAGANRDLWIDDLTFRTASIRLTFDEVINEPIWTPDGSRVIYTGGATAGNLFWRAADGSGAEERLTESPNLQMAGSVTPDGILVYQELDPVTGFDLWMLPLRPPPREPKRLLSTPRNEGLPRASPDGRWLAYQSNISGRVEVYLTSLPEIRSRIQVSQGGGRGPIWSRNGRELYFRALETVGNGQVMAVTVDGAGGEPRVSAPRVLFPGPLQGNGDVAPDGRFLFVKQTARESSTRVIQLVFDWFDDLQRKLPAP